MNTTKYDIFLKVLQTKSFTKTAEYFQYTQSAISQTIRSLENEMGVTLFHRTTDGVILTFEGQELLPAIQEIVRAHEHLEEALGTLHNNHMGRVRVGAYISLSCFWLPTCIKMFNELYPNISFELYQEDDLQILEWLRKGTIDFGFICDPHKREFHFLELFEDPFLLALPMEHLIEEKPTYSLKEFADNDFISLDIGYSKYIKEMFDTAGINPPIKYRTIDDASTIALVEKGFGVSLLPAFVTCRCPYEIQLVHPEESCSRHVGIVSRKKDHLSWSQKMFYEFAKDFDIDEYADNYTIPVSGRPIR